MTNEEAIKIIQNEYKCVDRECDIEKSCGKCPYMMPTKEPILKAYEMAIKALSQEPCDDAVSRDAAIEAVKQAIYNHDSAIMRLTELPSVTQKSGNPQSSEHFIDGVHAMGYREGYKDAQKQKSGHWIETEYHRWRCSVCREKGMSEWDNIHDVRTNYCPDCGAKMESEE